MLVTGYVHAGGNKEDPFAEVDLLLEERRYSEAMPLLSTILKDNPELLDEVRERTGRYLGVQREISDLEEGIIDDIRNENPRGIFEKIDLIRSLEPFPDEYRSAALDDYRYEAGIIVNSETVTAIMVEALAFLGRGQYWDAVALYASELDIGRDIFETAGHGNIAIDTALSARDGISDAANEFLALQEPFESAVGAKNAAFDGISIRELSAAVDALYSDLLYLVELQEAMDNYDRIVQETRGGLRGRREDNRDIAYLRYIHSFVAGRDEISNDEGMIYALGALWEEAQADFSDQAFAYLKEQFDSAKGEFDEGRWATAGERYRRVTAAAPVITKVFSLQSAVIHPGDGYALDEVDRSFIDTVAERILYARGRERVSATYLSALPRLLEAGKLGQISDFAPLGTLGSRRRQIDTAIDALNESSASVAAEAAFFLDLAGMGVDLAEEIELFEELDSLLAASVVDARDLDVSLASRISRIRIATLADEIEPLGPKVESGRRLVEGQLTSSTGEALGADATEFERADAIVKKYPERGRVALLGAKGDLDSALRSVSTLISSLRVDKDFVLADRRMVEAFAGGTVLRDRVNGLLREVDDLLRLADEEIRLARQFYDQSYGFLIDAVDLIEAEDFTSARTFLTAADSAMQESISHQQNDTFAREIGSRVAALTREINDQVVRIVVRDVAELLDRALRSYGRQEYEAAEGSLLQAQAKSATVFTDPDAVIEYWLATVQTALSVKTGRDIPETDSTYREMRQYLNYALADFRDAQQLLEANDRIGALNKLNDVEISLRVVLQRYPYNEEANLLIWQITKIEDVRKYNGDIRDTVNEARLAINTPAAADAYSTLQTIRRLEPDYAGLDDLIYQAEIKLGLVAPPKTVEKTNVALELYEDALALFESGDPEQFGEALDKLSQALIIEPGYTDASELRNKISIERGGNVATTLATHEDTQFFLKAVALFTDNRPGDALRIIIRLWANEANQHFAPLKNLRVQVYQAAGVAL